MVLSAVIDDLYLYPRERCDISEKVLYDDFEFRSTLVTDLNLVCEDQYKVALVGTAYMVGLLIGSLLGSAPADK